MPRHSVPSVADRLVLDLVARGGGALAPELRAWIDSAPRFRAFAESHRDKIRKKLRGAADHEALRDVRAELAVARLLLADRRFDLAFEAHGSGRRGPDFSVMFRTTRAFDLEVTRPHRVLDGASLVATVLTKLPQLQPSIANVLLVAAEADGPDIDVGREIRALRSRADAKDEVFFATRGSVGTKEFYERFLRLGAIALWRERGTTIWTNGSARIPVPGPALRALEAALTEPI